MSSFPELQEQNEAKTWVGQVLRRTPQHPEGLEGFTGIDSFAIDHEAKAVRVRPNFYPVETRPSPEILEQTAARFSEEHPGYSITFI